MKLEKILVDSAKTLDLYLDPYQVKQFIDYMELLKQWSGNINLTSILDDEEIILKHFIDSLTIREFIGSNTSVLDIGTGAGFPGIPLLICENSIKLTLIELVSKKVYFLKELKRRLKLNNCKIYNIRVEEVLEELKNSFDYVVIRAVGNFSKIIGLAKPYLKKSGKLIVMKGPKGLDEYNEYVGDNPNKVNLVDLREVSLPVLGDERIIVVLEYAT